MSSDADHEDKGQGQRQSISPSHSPAGQPSPATRGQLACVPQRWEVEQPELSKSMNIRLHETEREREGGKREREYVWLARYVGGGGGRWIDR